MENKSLILKTEREELLAELDKFRENNMTAKEKESIDKVEEHFRRLFFQLPRNLIGISRSQIEKLDKKKRRAFTDFISEKARWRAVFGVTVFSAPFFAPIVLTLALKEPLLLLSFILTGVYTFARGIYIGDKSFPVANLFFGPSWACCHFLKRLRKIYGKDYLPKI